MDIVKVFGTNLKNIVLNWDCHKKLLLTNVVCTAPILVQSNVIVAAFHLKTFSVLLMHLKLRLTNCFWRNLYEWIRGFSDKKHL